MQLNRCYTHKLIIRKVKNEIQIRLIRRNNFKKKEYNKYKKYGRAVHMKFDRTIIQNTSKQYGDYMNGYWVILEQFITKEN